MPAWPELTIAQCCTRVTSGGTPRRDNPDYYRDGTIPWVKTGELKDRVIDPSAISEWITEEAVENSSAKVLPKNTVLMAMYGDGRTIGSLGLVRSPMSCNQACCAMIVNPDICDAQFLFYAIRYYRNAWIKIAHGGAQRNLSGSIIRERKIAVPVLPLQRRIASILEAYDDLIEVNRRRIAVLEEMARRLFDEWFVQFRYPGHECHATIDTPDGRRPEGWQHRPLEDMLVLQRGFDLPTSKRTPGPFPVISASGVHGTHAAAKVRGPAIVTGRSGTIGNVMIVHEDLWPLNTTLYVKEFRKASPAYALHLLRRLDLHIRRGGAAVPTLNRNHLHNIPIVCPPSNLVVRYEEVAMSQLRAAFVIEQQQAILTASRDLLIPRLISGGLSIPGAERELEAVA
ncbi:restriction endonuclease subunit S [Bradyrhizobium sp. CCBAU 25360]|uniref:restriction endonuclease subunit S n=1 Tax=Bradyrhizobium sp. CCBAU 25360 TaxID=858425 RepID=UPI002306C7C3|nr:restriction endonuclease subunit S [Bradyrhizobium sp. CCBAU 25360]